MEMYLHSFLTSALDGGKYSASRSGHLHRWKTFPEPIKQESRWAPQAVWMFRKRDETLASAGIRTAFRPAHNLGTILSELFRLPLAHVYENK